MRTLHRNRERALLEQAWLQPGRFAIGVQVLQEFHVYFVRRGRPAAEATALTADFALWPVIDPSLAAFRLGLALQALWQLSLWDAMILSTTEKSGARELLNGGSTHGNSKFST